MNWQRVFDAVATEAGIVAAVLLAANVAQGVLLKKVWEAWKADRKAAADHSAANIPAMERLTGVVITLDGWIRGRLG